jgi:nitrogen-specific signal transduction histidine kinase
VSGPQFGDKRCPSNASGRRPSPHIVHRIALEEAGRSQGFRSGMDSMAVDRVFKPFFTTKLQGMDLGLSICKSIVESHGGRFVIMPAVHRGTMFRIVLPRSELESR